MLVWTCWVIKYGALVQYSNGVTKIRVVAHLLVSCGLELASSHASEARMLPVANAIDESEAP